MPPSLWLFTGIVLGVLATALAARLVIRRSLARTLVAERRARSAERLAEIGAMTGGLAHEIKNPLSTLGLNVQLLEEGLDELEIEEEKRSRLSRRLQSLKREVDRLRGILQDFLEYAGELRLDMKVSDLNTAVDELADFFLPQAEKSGVRLRLDLAPGELLADMDSQRVKQAALNLMLNAVQVMGGLDAQTSDSPAPRELIVRTMREVDAEKREFVTLHVIDTGPGIAKERQQKIFDPYFTTKAGGTGLGLPTSRRIIEAHHGRLELISELGKGTDFVIKLPAVAARV